MALSQRIDFRERLRIRSADEGLESCLNTLYLSTLIMKSLNSALGVLSKVVFQRGEASSFLRAKRGEFIELRNI